MPKAKRKTSTKPATATDVAVDKLRRAHAQDAFSNPLARMGFGTSNLGEGAQYPLTRLSRNYILMQSLYRGSWIVRKVIDGMAEDMVKAWIQIVSEMDPKQIDKFDRIIDSTGTQEKLLSGIKWGRLFGGAGAVIIIKGHGEMLDQPLELDDIDLGSYQGLLVFDRWSGITPSVKINSDINKPREFGLPESYRVTTETGPSYDVHSSRVLRFIGRELPQWEWQAEQRWGISEVEVMFDELKKRDNTSWNIASLIFRANIIALKQKDLSQILSGVGKSAGALQQFYSMLTAQTQLMSNQGLMVLPEAGGLETHQYGFAGINDVYVSFMLDICGATEYSMSRLFGRSATGLGQTNEGDEHMYHDLIAQKQKRELNPQLKKLFPIICMSEFGEVPEDLDWQFNPIRSLSNEEQAELASKQTTAIVETYNAGLIGRKTALMELRNISEVTGMYSNISNQQIEEADDEPIGEGDIGGSLKDLPGKEEKGLELGEAGKEGDNKPEKRGEEEGKDDKKAKDAAFTWDTTFQGLKITIENDIGSIRSGVNSRTGEPWMVTMTAPYGFVKHTKGTDGDEVDCFLGPNLDAVYAFVIHTQDPITREYDEDKLMLAFGTAASARESFMQNYSDPQFFDSMEAISMADLPEKLKTLRGRKLTERDTLGALTALVNKQKLSV